MIESHLQPLLAVALAALFAAPASDTTSRPVRTLPPIEVAAERARLDARRRMPTASVTDLRAGDSGHALDAVGDLLATAVGARLVQYGGLGSFSTLSLRGAAPGQVSVFLDGVPLTSAAHGAVDLSDLPAAALDRLEVYRGSAPLGFGAATPGGAVNLVTLDEANVRRLRVAAGSFGTWEGSGTLAATRGTLGVLAHAGYEGSRGDFAFRDDNGTPFNLADDATVTRRNDRFDAAHALARVAWAPRAHERVTLRADGFRKALGVPGLGAVQAPNPRLTFARGRLALDGARESVGALPGLALRAHAQQEASHFRDLEGELRLGRQDATSRFFDRGVALEASSPAAWPWLTATAGAETRDERAEPAPPTLGQPLPPVTTRATASAWAGAQLHALGDALLVHAARRWDRQRDALRATVVGGAAWASDARRVLNAPQLGARVRLPHLLEARANWSRTARAPEFGELFGDGAVVAASPKLQPERAESWDAGGAWSATGRARGRAWSAGFEWTRFATHARQLIAWVPAAQRTVRATNLARAEIRGEELSARVAWGPLAAAGATGWTSALQTDAGNLYYGRRLPLRPAHTSALRLDARAGAWRATADVLALGDDFLDPINFQRLAPRTLVGAALARTWGALTWSLEARNLGDRRVQDVAGYPLPGRTVFVACALRGGADSTSQP